MAGAQLDDRLEAHLGAGIDPQPRVDVEPDPSALPREGLHRRARRNTAGEDETHFLDPLFAIAGSGRTPAEELLEDFHTRWSGKIDPVFTEYSY